jgi:DNA helicase-2/ATP-dependent DNA helicase PcrA
MSIYDSLNPMQREAVEHTEGPLLILAGAGSGKTRVLTHRIAWLIEKQQVNPWNIMAITFTNKAAKEMRERVDAIVGCGSEAVWVATFHSSCVRILRRFIDRLGYSGNFTIYDADDSKAVMKEVMRRLDMDPKIYKERGLLAKISAAKNEMISPEEYARSAVRWEEKKAAEAYQEYQARLRQNNALDFDDLLVKTVELFRADPEVLGYYQERFRYILVDEYQDTNTVQFEFVRLLASRYKNLCVVGDDDQSIYKFRGANIGNILGFERVFPEARVVKLEQNYRSTQNILNAANEVIAHNTGRKAKHLWTENEEGPLIAFRQFQNGFEEAEYIAGDISGKVRSGQDRYQDFAVLYRTNAQSRLFEEKFLTANIPYKLVGGVNFYARKEIKDLLAYLKTVDNGLDDLAVQRIINVPRRGIGAATIGKVEEYAADQQISFYDALLEAENIGDLGRSLTKLRAFTTFIQSLRSVSGYLPVKELLEKIIEDTGYVKELEAEDTDESRARIENIDELLSKAADYEETAETPTLGGFLQEVALVADIDSVEESSDYVLLMTLHSAKGLEFDHVYMAGMEDGLFPSYMTITGGDSSELEEERRLCYVGITRARKSLTMTAAMMRMVRGETQYCKTSRFVREIPRELVDLGRDAQPRGSYGGSGGKSALFGKASPFGDGGHSSGRPAVTFQPRQFTVNKAKTLDYGVGDTVRHVKFGVGVVRDITEGGKDYEVTVEFEQAGIKRMFASFARLKKISV